MGDLQPNTPVVKPTEKPVPVSEDDHAVLLDDKEIMEDDDNEGT